MSDPMSRHEIEDVLSSIRRLVAQEVAAPAGTSDAGAVRSGKLILSPACRVETGAATVARLTRTPAATDPAPPAAAPMPGTLEATIAELEAAVGAQPNAWEPERGDPPAFVSSRAQVPMPAVSDDADTDADADTDVDTDPATGLEPAEEAPMMADAPTLPAGDNVRPFAPVRPEAPPAVTSAPEPVPAAGVEATPDAAPGDGDDLLLGNDPGAILDEAALRDLVAQILREELQGVLGQRITRNVRKMVRAEIAQALAARSLRGGFDPD